MNTQTEATPYFKDQVKINEVEREGENKKNIGTLLLEGYDTKRGYVPGYNSLGLEPIKDLKDFKNFITFPENFVNERILLKADEKEKLNKDRSRLIEQYTNDNIDAYINNLDKHFGSSFSNMQRDIEWVDFVNGKVIVNKGYLEEQKAKHILFIDSEAQEQVLKAVEKIVSQVKELNKILKPCGSFIEFKDKGLIVSHVQTGEPMIDKKTLNFVLKNI